MDLPDNLLRAKKATQWVFLVCGLGLSSWAPMVPFAKDRLSLNAADLGVLLLVLGLGAMIMMPLSGAVMGRIGSRRVMMTGTLVTACTLPWLLLIGSYLGMAVALFIFGCGVGMIDVAMNAHGIRVQNLYGRPIMSSLHGLFSVGGLFGALGLGFLIKMGLDPLYAAIAIAFVLVILVGSQYRNLLSHRFERETILKTSPGRNESGKTRFQWLNASILLLGFMCFSVFLSEGAMLDWSAVFLRDRRGISLEFAGAGYAAFSVSMAVMRLVGDKIVEKLSGSTVVLSGCVIAVTGLVMVMASPWIPLVLAGFMLLGIGASNLVPIFFSEGGRLPGISPAISIAAITTMGYAGQLSGPVFLGYVAHKFSLEAAFGVIAFLMAAVAVIYGFRRNI
jgi:predicted MFS family arabinose efflux permease